MRTIGESVLRVASATNLYPPDNVYLADARTGTLVFNWTPVISNCSIPFLQYSITSDCGACPPVTNLTTANCSRLQLTTDAIMCNFRVSSQVCGLVGNPSSPTAVTLKVPDVPHVEIVPGYSTDSQALERLFIVVTVNQTEDQFYISSNISGSPTSYTAYGFNLISGTSFNSTVRLTSCEEAGGCPIEVPSPFCSQSTIINVTISTTNRLGGGPRSNPFMIECSNTFVEVLYRKNSTGSFISCIFLNQSDTSEKICCVTYGPCDQNKELESRQVCKRDSPYNIQLEVAVHSRQTYCYTVTASNDTHTVKVEGTFIFGDNSRGNSNTAAITAGVVIPIVFILLLLGTGILVVCVTIKRRTSQMQIECVKTTSISLPESDMIYSRNPLKPYLTPYTIPATSKLHKVNGDYNDLREFVVEVSRSPTKFRRGHTHYEFTNEVENILDGKEVLLLQEKQDTKEWFRLAPPEKVAAGGLKLYGIGITRSSFGNRYRVFIQSFGSGARHLPDGSWILYNHSKDQVEPDILPLVPVCSEHFVHKVINSEEGLSAQQFCTQNGLNPKAFNLFLTVEHLPEGMRGQPPRDVILMDRVSRQLFTGPFARQLLDPKKKGESQNEKEKWKIFVLLEKNKQGVVLNKDSEILYQDSNYQAGNYTVLDVDEDCVRLSKFIEMKINCQYEDGKAFYAVTETEEETEEEDESKREEDLFYYKKILRPTKNELSCKELKLESLIEFFYSIPGVPSMAIKPEQLRLRFSSRIHHRDQGASRREKRYFILRSTADESLLPSL